MRSWESVPATPQGAGRRGGRRLHGGGVHLGQPSPQRCPVDSAASLSSCRLRLAPSTSPSARQRSRRIASSRIRRTLPRITRPQVRQSSCGLQPVSRAPVISSGPPLSSRFRISAASPVRRRGGLAEHVPAGGQRQGGADHPFVGHADHQLVRKVGEQALQPCPDFARALAAGRPKIEAPGLVRRHRRRASRRADRQACGPPRRPSPSRSGAARARPGGR